MYSEHSVAPNATELNEEQSLLTARAIGGVYIALQ